MAQMRQALAAYRAAGASVLTEWFLALLAEAYGHMGQARRGAEHPGRGAGRAQDTDDERCYEAELYRLKGEICSGALGGASRGGDLFSRPSPWPAASGKSCELRAATSLSRLWQHQGKRHEARATPG